MKSPSIIFLFLSFLFHLYGFSQDTAYITGTLTDPYTSWPVFGVKVSAGNQATWTGDNGEFNLTVDTGLTDILFTSYGYHDILIDSVELEPGEVYIIDTTVSIRPVPPFQVDAEMMGNYVHVTWAVSGPVVGYYKYDDGEPEDYILWQYAGSQNAVKFPRTYWSSHVIGGQVFVGDGSFPGPFLGTDFEIRVYDESGPGDMPGELIESDTVVANNYGWVVFDQLNSWITTDHYYLSMYQLNDAPEAAPVGVDMSSAGYYGDHSYSKFLDMDWCLSAYQNFMIRPWMASRHDSVYPVTCIVGRLSDFDPNGNPWNGILTLLSSTNSGYYDDMAWAGLTTGCYVYVVRAVYNTGERSEWTMSEIVCWPVYIDLTVNLTLSTGLSPEGTEISLSGENNYQAVIPATGTVVFDSIPNGTYELRAYKPGFDEYLIDELVVDTNQNNIVNIIMAEKRYPVRNFRVDSSTLIATWDEPLITVLSENFDEVTFPSAGWLMFSEGEGWYRTASGSSTNWTIPDWPGYYACVNDDKAGAANDGCCDILGTPVVDLRETENFILQFDSYFDGANGQKAYVVFSRDEGIHWWALDTISPDTSWTRHQIDLSYFSGPYGDRAIRFGFHADDNGQQASGWAVDNVSIYVPDPPAGFLDYEIFIDSAYLGNTLENSYYFGYLPYGTGFTVCVAAGYSSGLSETRCVCTVSRFLYPPKDFTAEGIVLLWEQPYNTTGLIGYNLYRDEIFFQFIEAGTTSFIFDSCYPGHYEYCVAAIYDLEIFGYPGEVGESKSICDTTTYITGHLLDFTEDWSSSSFDTNGWVTGEDSFWKITADAGNPAPSAFFNGSSPDRDYSMALESYPFNNTDSNRLEDIYLDFELSLESISSAGDEKMVIQVRNWDNESWYTLEEINNSNGSFDWHSYSYNISEYAVDKVFSTRFLALGLETSEVNWLLDNIKIYRLCRGADTISSALIDDKNIRVIWSVPQPGADQLKWCNDEYFTAIGAENVLEFDAACRFRPIDLEDQVGSQIVSVDFYPVEEWASFSIRIWIGPNASELLTDQIVETPVIDRWNTIHLQESIKIAEGKEYWAGFHVVTSSGYPAGSDAGPANDSLGNMIYWNNKWLLLHDLHPSYQYNWNIRMNTQKTALSVKLFRSINDGDFNQTGEININHICQDHFIDSNLTANKYCYKVQYQWSNNYDTCLSKFSDETCEVVAGIIDNGPGGHGISIRPNPSKEYFMISCQDCTLKEISIYDISGKIIFFTETNEETITINARDYDPGIYIARIKTHNEVISQKLVIY